MPDNFNTIEGTEVLNLNDGVQGSHAVTVDDIKEYTNTGIPGELVFEAYIRQSGGDNSIFITSGTLEIGKTYYISNYQSSDDFTNVGAVDNSIGTRFVATGTTPAVWTNGSELEYNTGSPTVSYILQDTLGFSGFTYRGLGQYRVNFPNNLIQEKTFVEFGAMHSPSLLPSIGVWMWEDTSFVTIQSRVVGDPEIDIFNTRIKVVLLP